MQIFCITNRKLCYEDFIIRIKKILCLGIDALILREKDLPLESYIALCKVISPLCIDNGVKLIVHKYIEVANLLPKPRLHTPLSVACAIRPSLIKPLFDFGISCHSMDDIICAQNLNCSYITLSPIFTTKCKPSAIPKTPNFIIQASAICKVPIIALGGITPNTTLQLPLNKIQGVAIMSDFMTVPNISSYIQQLRNSLTI